MDISWLKNIYLLGFLNMWLWLVISLVNAPLIDCVYYLFTVVMWHLSLYYIHTLRPVPVADAVPEAGPADTPDRNYFSPAALRSWWKRSAFISTPT